MFGGKLRLPVEFVVVQERENETLPAREFVKSLAQRVASFRYHPPRKTDRSSHLDYGFIQTPGHSCVCKR